nr:nuclear transport factor 2 family protein [Mucilaginibacter straminoryzae]
MSLRAQDVNGSNADSGSLERATAALREAFAKGDIALVVKLHHPDIVKYFGGKNVVTGRAELEKGVREWLTNSHVEFIENKVESTFFNKGTAVQTSIFTIRNTPKSGGKPTIGRGRSMVVYVKDSSSPTGWLSVREIVQEAPPEI